MQKISAETVYYIFINLSSGWLALVVIYPASGSDNVIVIIRNLFFGYIFYLLAVKIKVWIHKKSTRNYIDR